MMSYKCFGQLLIRTGDLDPIYIMLTKARQDNKLDDNTLKRWMLAYWCYYSAGVASRIAESNNFYKEMWMAYHKNWPRGHERRHFRGEAAVKALRHLEWRGTPEAVVDNMTLHPTFQEIAKHVQSYVLFGPWISWKVADMAERVLCYDIDFSDCELGIYKDPVQGAALIKHGDWKHDISRDELHEVVAQLMGDFGGYAAPPWDDRPINVQEIETILCKYKAHVKGFYPYGLDTRDVRHGLKGWGDLAESLIPYLPQHFLN